MNRECIHAYALQNRKIIYQILAVSKNGQVPSSYFPLRDDTTGRMCMLLELVIGMPVSCTQNNISYGLANGTLADLKGIQWAQNTTFTSFFTDSGVNILRASHLPDYIFI